MEESQTSEIETSSYEPNRIREEFERRAKEAQCNKNIKLLSKTTRLIEKFEKKSQMFNNDGSNNTINNNNSHVNNIKKVFEPFPPENDCETDSPDRVITAGSTNKLIGIFQQQDGFNVKDCTTR